MTYEDLGERILKEGITAGELQRLVILNQGTTFEDFLDVVAQALEASMGMSLTERMSCVGAAVKKIGKLRIVDCDG